MGFWYKQYKIYYPKRQNNHQEKAQVWQHMPLSKHLEWRGKWLSAFKAGLAYIVDMFYIHEAFKTHYSSQHSVSLLESHRVLRELRQGDRREFEARLGYTVSFRSAWTRVRPYLTPSLPLHSQPPIREQKTTK